MQSPSLSLLSLFGVQPMPDGASTSGLLGAPEMEEHSSFFTMFNTLLSGTEGTTEQQSLPLVLTAAAAEPLPTPALAEQTTVKQLAEIKDLPELDELVDLEELTPEQMQLLHNLLAQMNMQELQPIPKAPAKPSKISELVAQTHTPSFVDPEFANEMATTLQRSALEISRVDTSQLATATAIPTRAASVTIDVAETEDLVEESLQHLLNKPEVSANAGAVTTEPATTAPSAQILQQNPAPVTAVNGAAEIAQPTPTPTPAPAPAQSTSIAANATLVAEQELQQQLNNATRLQFGPDTQQWGGALASRIVTMVAEDIQQARIHLDPPELGSLEIKLQIHNQQATVHVQAQHGQVRDVLEAHAQRLRESLAEQGIDLSDFDVSEQSQQQGGGQQQFADAEHNQTTTTAAGQSNNGVWLDESDDSLAVTTQTSQKTMNLLDTYA